jgi:hypothetical protein
LAAGAAIGISTGPRTAAPAPAPHAPATPAKAAPASARAASHHALKMMWGPVRLPNGKSAFPVYDRLGVDVFQLVLQWDAVAAKRPANPDAPSDPAYSWPADLDFAVAQARKHGIKVALQVRGTPSWANGGKDPSVAPTDDDDYGNFLKAAATRYSGVHHWMIWGEPTRPGNFSPMPDNSPVGPRRYAKLLDTAYGALKARSRANKVIGAMTWTLGLVKPPDFVKWMKLPDGKPPRMDYWGHNPFSNRFPALKKKTYYPGLRDLSDIDTFHREISRVYRTAGRPVPDFWLSEFTISSSESRAFNFSTGLKGQARWLTRSYSIADQAPYVRGLGWFTLLDEPTSIKRHLTNGLLTYTMKRKPSYDAYRKVP